MVKNKLFSVLVLAGALFLLSLWPPSAGSAIETAYAADITIVVDGNTISSDVPPTIVQGRTLVPVRAVSESLNAQVAWNDALRTVTIAKGSMVMSLQVSKSEYIMNGMIKSLDVPVQILDGRTMVPLRVIGEAFGASVTWDDAARTVRIANTNQPAPVNPGNVVVQNGTIRITENEVNIRRGPGTSHEIAQRARKGDTFNLIGVSGDWFQIRLADGSVAFVANWLAEVFDPTVASTPTPEPPVEPTPTEPVNTVHNQPFISLYNKVNLRSGPGTNYDILGQISRGTELTALGMQGDWYQMNYNGRTVWVAGHLVSSDVAGIKAEIAAAAAVVTPVANNSGNQGEPNKAPAMRVIETKSELGQSWVTFDVGAADVTVLNNNKEEITVQIVGVQVPAGFDNPVAGIHPFADMRLENSGTNAVKITTRVTDNGYFRLDRINNRFSIMAVAKHKNGEVGLQGKTIVLDPGHGNYGSGGKVDPGAISKHNGLSEVDFNTPLSLKLKAKLEAAGARVILTREAAPVNITLAGRAALANDNAADAFISIHGDSATNTSAYGAGTWLYTGDLRLTSAAQKDMRNEFAKAINSGLANATGRPAYIKYANFAVTRENEVPSVLVESAFLSNPDDAALLATDAYQEKLAQGLFDGLANYFSY